MAASTPAFHPLIGRTFAKPSIDYLLIGGGLSLLLVPAIYMVTGSKFMGNFPYVPWVILFSNSSHFAASTVRLYTKPDAKQSLPFLTYVLPLLTIAILTTALFMADQVGRYFQIVYLTWSPYHYAAQAYGLSVMYAHRSGCHMSAGWKRVWWWICVLPFLKVLWVTAVAYLLPNFVDMDSFITTSTNAQINMVPVLLGFLGVICPCVFFAVVWSKSRRGGADSEHPTSPDQSLPLISLLIVLTNALWFVLFEVIEAFLWATIFHGIQYLAIVMVFHVKDQMSLPNNRHGRVYHGLWFYGACAVLGYALFNCWPYGYQMLGFHRGESVLMVAAAINIHHFIVDGYIWRVGRDQRNRKIVEV